jgi:peptidoglycan/xylan/chitin deacetylase (PgdA/CDA1 family)
MTAEQVKALAQSPLVSIGAHGCYHNDLAKINPADAARELILTKHYLENLTGREVKSIAFPYGSYNQAVIDAAEQTAYTQLLATDFNDEGDSQNTLLRERFTVNPFISVNNQMYATVTGSYER